MTHLAKYRKAIAAFIAPFLSHYRKAIAAFVVPFLGLPLAGWLSGEVEFNPSLLAGAVVGGISGVLTYLFPNAETS